MPRLKIEEKNINKNIFLSLEDNIVWSFSLYTESKPLLEAQYGELRKKKRRKERKTGWNQIGEGRMRADAHTESRGEEMAPPLPCVCNISVKARLCQNQISAGCTRTQPMR